MVPLTSERNFTPSSTAASAPASTRAGAWLLVQMVQALRHAVTVTLTPAEGVSRLPLSSTDRLRMVVAPAILVTQVKVQFSRPDAGCHVVPPSVETSTPATTPPPVSAAVPEIVTV